MRNAIWYFDFISPFAYIGLHRLKELPADLSIEYRPVLFAGILNHWGQKGPAELPTKRRYTYRWSHWWAQFGIPLRYPAAHPSTLHHLCSRSPAAPGPRDCTIFDDIWTTGADASDPERFSALSKKLGVTEQDPKAKDILRSNTETAIARGVFGVPTIEVDGELFWGADSMEFLKAFLKDSSVVNNPEMQRLDNLPVAAARRTS
jgi:2-hydroxychromene-2-carboxylate isomerase